MANNPFDMAGNSQLGLDEAARPKSEAELSWDSWMSQRQTKEFFQVFLARWREDLKEQWAQGCFTSQENRQQTIDANLQGVAQVNLLQQLIDLDFDSYEKVIKDE